MDGDPEEEGAPDRWEAGLEAAYRDSERVPIPHAQSVLAALDPEGRLRAASVRLREEPGATTPVTTPRPSAVGRYELLGEIARGGMGVVMRGRDVDLGRDVAIKMLREGDAGDPARLQRFVEEAQIGGQLQHPGIVPVYELGTGEGRCPYISMKLVKGRTLAALLRERRDTTDGRARFVSIFASVCQTVAYAHARDVIHRDLKPANVMVGAFGEVLVVDWGMAKVLHRRTADDERSAGSADEASEIHTSEARRGTGAESVAGTVMGTPSYMSPEQAQGAVDSLDERTDVFGLGAILCEILTGRAPYDASGVEALRDAMAGRLEGAHALLKECGADSDLIALARACLAALPADRPRNAGLVAERVAAHLASLEEQRRRAEADAVRATVTAREERKRRRLTVALAASVVGLLALAVGTGLYLDGQRREREQAADRLVGAALDEATALRSRAATTGDPATWDQAVAAARRAGDVAHEQTAGPVLRQRAIRALTDVEADAERARASREQAQEDRELAEALEAIRLAEADHGDGGRLASELREALAARGMAPGPPADLEPIAARIRSSSIASQVVAALDEWAAAASRTGGADSTLEDLLRLVDDDPLRQRLRTARAPDELRTIARDVVADTASVESLVALADRLGRAGDVEPAKALLRDAVAKHPQDFWANFRASYWSAAGGLRELEFVGVESLVKEGLEYSGAALALRPGSPWVHCHRSKRLLMVGEVQAAEHAARMALSLAPDTPEFHHNLSRILLSKGEYAGAAEASRHAVRLAPDSVRYLARYAATTARFDRPAAEASLRRLLELWPNDARALYSASVIRQSQGDWDGALNAARAAAQREPASAGLRTRLAFFLILRGDVREAEVAARESIRLDPEQSTVRAFHANALFRLGELDEARRACIEALRRKPGSSEARNILGLLSQMAGENESAIASFREAIEADPNDPNAYCNLGQVLRDVGRFREALAMFERGQALAQRGGLSYPTAEWIEETTEMLRLEPHLASVMAGSHEPAAGSEMFAFARMCDMRGAHVSAARLYAKSLPSPWWESREPLAQALGFQDAAGAAAAASSGQGIDQDRLGAAERTRWREQAVEWLHEFVRLLSTVAEKDPIHVLNMTVPMAADRAFEGIRDPMAVVQLPASEQASIRRLWDAIHALQERARKPR